MNETPAPVLAQIQIQERTGEDCVASNGFCLGLDRRQLRPLRRPVLEHIFLTVVSVGIGFAIAFGLALLAHQRRWTFKPFSAATRVLYTVPCLPPSSSCSRSPGGET